MPAKTYIAVDLGAESGRVMIGVLDEGKLSMEEIHRFGNGPVRLHGTLRWDVLRLWDDIKEGLRKVAARGAPVESVSVDSWGVDYVLMKDGEPMLRAPFCYRDVRAEKPYRELSERLGERIYAETGVQFMSLNTLYQLAAEKAGQPGVLASAEQFLMIGDWFHFLLSGRAAQEESNASTTQAWNPRRRTWSDEVIESVGLPRRVFPQVVAPCTRLGSLTEAVRSETNLGAIDVVAGCVHDTGAAVAAVPAEGNEWAYLSSGTWSLIGVELPKPLITAEGRAANFTNETGFGGTSRFLRNASGLWILQECRRAWAHEGKSFSYDELTALADSAEPFRSLIDPTDEAFLRPEGMPAAVQNYCRQKGQPEPESPGQFVRCALESLALLYGQLLGQLETITGRTLTTLHIVGGGSRNGLLNQMTAEATGRRVLAGPVEATAIGNVLLQALTKGHIASQADLRAVVRRSFPIQSLMPSGDSAWVSARSRFSEICCGAS